LSYTLTRLMTAQHRSDDEIHAYVTRLCQQMNRAFPDATVTGWEPLLPGITVPDPDDAHVAAAAITANAGVIVTSDQRGFTSGLPAAIKVRAPDEFLLDALDLAPAAVMASVHAVAERTGRHGPRHTTHDIVGRLQASTPRFSATVLDRITEPIDGNG
jgi:hypothetical protein